MAQQSAHNAERFAALSEEDALHQAPWLSPEGSATGCTDMADLARALPWAQDEAEFVTDLQAGSDAAFDLLVTHYQAPVYSLLYSMLGNPADAADATQEVFLKAFRGIRGFRRGSSLKTWLYRIAVREALNQRRWWWRHRRQQVSLDLPDEETGRPALELEDGDASPFDRMASHEVQEVVQRALLRVPAVFRTAVILRDLEGFSYEEVAEVLETNPGTVKSRIVRGRAALRQILAPWLEAQQRRGSSRDAHPAAAAGGTPLASGLSSAVGMFTELGDGSAEGGGR